jgi:diaminobutyrate-2-oxoglutarate transaminase
MTIAADPVVVTTAERAARAVFEDLESDVRLYCRTFPVVFTRARGAELCTEDGRRFVDLFAGGGALNYGHNNAFIKRRLLDYLAADGIGYGLDMYTVAKREFLKTFNEAVLRPLDLDFKVQFCGLTGADAVTAALTLARKVTGRRGVISFTGARHAVPGATVVPYAEGLAMIERVAEVAAPAAIIVEPVQLEGGVFAAPAEWLRSVRAIADRHAIQLIFDETQTGCGRTGTFFGFEHSGVQPDLITVAKSVGGYGVPLSMVLLRRDLDIWQPGEHTGAFRGSQLAFVAATAACELWSDTQFRTNMAVASRRLGRFRAGLRDFVARGRGMLLGIDLGSVDRAERLQRYAFGRDVLVDLCARRDGVVKVMPPLSIDIARLDRGLDVLRDGLRTV